jgi:hypothetical protein
MACSIESAAGVCTSIRCRSILGGARAPIKGCNWSEMVCWQSVRAGQKCLSKMSANTWSVRYAGLVRQDLGGIVC